MRPLTILTALIALTPAVGLCCTQPEPQIRVESIGVLDGGAIDGGLAVIADADGSWLDGPQTATVEVLDASGAAIPGEVQELARFSQGTETFDERVLFVWRPDAPLTAATTYSAQVVLDWGDECFQPDCTASETLDFTTSEASVGDLAPYQASAEVTREWIPKTERVYDDLQPSCIWEDVTVDQLDRVVVRARIEGRAAWDRARLHVGVALGESRKSTRVRLRDALTVRVDPAEWPSDTVCAWIDVEDPLGRTARTDLGCSPFDAAGPRPDADTEASKSGGCSVAPADDGPWAWALALLGLIAARRRRG